jgi:hypothetical protein
MTYPANVDQIFLVDDAISMRPRWSDVGNVFAKLSYLAKTVDDDGKIELRFTSTPGQVETSKSSSKLSRMVQDRRNGLSIRTNPMPALLSILQDCQDAMKNAKLLSLLGRRPKFQPVTIYIMTDGVWQDKTDLKEFFANVVSFLVRESKPSRYFGFQFIHFGDDLGGMAR